MSLDARHLTKALSEPAYALGLNAGQWAALLAMAEAEGLTSSLADRLKGLPVPADVAETLAGAQQGDERREPTLIDAVADLLTKGDLTGGLRKLWEIDRIVREGTDQGDFWQQLHATSAKRGLTHHLSRALRLSHHLFDTPVDPWLAWQGRRGDVFYLGRLLARNGKGEETRKILRLAFKVRAWWIGMREHDGG